MGTRRQELGRLLNGRFWPGKGLSGMSGLETQRMKAAVCRFAIRRAFSRSIRAPRVVGNNQACSVFASYAHPMPLPDLNRLLRSEFMR